jgi:hypothetical protein
MSALIIDNLFKSILVRLDQIYTVKDGIIEDFENETSLKLSKMKIACQ